MDILHHQINVLAIVVSLKVFYDVGVVKCVQDPNLFNDLVDVLSEFVLIQDFDSNFVTNIVLVVGHEHSAEGSNAEDFRIGVDNVAQFQLVNTLLLTASNSRDTLSIQGF